MAKAVKNNRSKRKKTSFAKKNRKRYISKSFTNETVKRSWDNERSVDQNFKVIGLLADPNKITSDPAKEPTEAVKELLLREEDPDAAPVRGLYFMTEEEQLYLKTLIRKYGDNHMKMFKDTKMNYQQYTESHLKRRCERYHLLKASEEAAGSA